MRPHALSRSRLLAWACAALMAGAAAAQTYPARPVRLVVPFAPGGGTDILARALAQHLSRALEGSVVVENRPGAGGSLGTDAVAKATPDGYTLLMATNATLALAPGLYPKLPYDPARDFAAVAQVAAGPNVLVVHPQVPATDTASLLRHARSMPGRLNYGSAGNGSMAHISTNLFNRAGGVDTVHVPFKGGGPAVQELVAGRLQFMIAGPAEALPQVDAGRLRALAVTTAARFAGLPNLPPLADTLPGYEIANWFGVTAPAGLPAGIAATLSRHIRDWLAQRDVQQMLLRQGMEAQSLDSAAFGELIRSEVTKWTREVRQMGIALD